MHTTRLRLRWALTLCLLPLSALATEYERSTLWNDAPIRSRLQAHQHADTAHLQRFRTLSAPTTSIRGLLQGAPERRAGAEGVTLDIPLPNNRFARFRLFEDSVMAPELAAKFPHIRTFFGYDESDPGNRGRFDLTDKGFRGMFRYDGERMLIDPLKSAGPDTYIAFRAKDAGPRPAFADRIDMTPADHQRHSAQRAAAAALPPTQPDGQLRRYRLAVATTGEYAQFHGGTVSGGLSAVVTAINRVNEIYEVDLSVRLDLVANNDQLIYTNPSTDPYTNGNSDLNSNTGNINSVIGSGSYDVGHIFQTSGGGVAGLGVVCSGSKGRGLTGLTQPVGDPFYIDYVAHEIGHQFDGLHTFNGTSRSCGGGNRSGSAAYEPGSGSTIMAYAGICDDENLQNNSDPFFHTHSITEINDFITNGGGRTCTQIENPNNTPPTAEAGPNLTIPANTPFVLNGEASDPDSGDQAQLTYVWEQYDLGASSSSPGTMVDNGNRPIFRSFEPSTDPTRTLPRFEDLLSDTDTLGVSLPTTNRDLTFRLTVRDGNGGVAIDDRVLSVVNTGSAFALTQPVAGATLGNANVAVSWNVAGTNAAPINCSTVDIDYSSNNGTNFQTVATALSNTGNARLGLPATATTNARLRVRCSDNLFFALSGRFSVEVSGPNQAPSFSSDSISKIDAAVGTAYSGSLAGDASDPEGDALSFSKISGPDWLNVAANGALGGTPAESDLGPNTFTVSVSDGEFSDSTELQIAVVAPRSIVGTTTVGTTSTQTQNRRAMPYTMPENGTLESIAMYHNAGSGDMILAVYADAGDSPGALLAETPATPVAGTTDWQTIALENPVFVAAGEQIWLAWIYEDNPGIYYISASPGRANVNITWQDGADNMPESFGSSTRADFRYSIYANYLPGGSPSNTPPVFGADTITKTAATEGEAYDGSLADDASDADGDTLTFSKVGGPAWLSVADNGALSGTPSLEDLGENRFTVAVSDGTDDATATLVIEVEAGAATADIGITTIGNQTSVSGSRRAMPFSMPEDGDIESISIYHAGGPGRLILAVYADAGGTPGELLGSSGEVGLNGSEGWQTVALNNTVALSANEAIWLAWIFEDNPGIRYVTGSPGRAQSASTWADGSDNMPASFGTSGQANFRYSIYATYSRR